MLFSSITFLYYFFPITFLLYLLVPKQLRNLMLFITSLVFYAWGEPRYVLLMLFSICIGYAAGLLMDRLPKRLVVIAAVALCLALLLYFKYANFVFSNVNALLHTKLPLLKVVMPIGISFYTFQIISYILDVFYGRVEKQKSFLTLASYITMFPQLIAGPIVRYSDIQQELTARRLNREAWAEGIRRFILGLGKKVLLANQLGELCNAFRTSQEQTICFYWLYAIATMLHIYFDFSGYSDMAIGLGRLLGFHFPENFDYPFMSKSVTEFWRRWHMTLGSWFRDYVYIPLGGNRVGKVRWLVNISVVWALTGLWHGAEWNFIIWGVLFAVLLIVEKIWLLDILKRAGGWNHVYLLLVTAISFVIFNADGVGQMLSDLKGLVVCDGSRLVGGECFYYAKSYGWILLIAIVGATSVPRDTWRKARMNAAVDKVLAVLEPAGLIFVLLLSTAYLIDGSFNPFLYFRF